MFVTNGYLRLNHQYCLSSGTVEVMYTNGIVELYDQGFGTGTVNVYTGGIALAGAISGDSLASTVDTNVGGDLYVTGTCQFDGDMALGSAAASLVRISRASSSASTLSASIEAGCR